MTTTKKLIFSVAEAAEVLGCHKETVYKSVRLGRIPHFIIGSNRICIPIASLEKMLGIYDGPVDDAQEGAARPGNDNNQ